MCETWQTCVYKFCLVFFKALGILLFRGGSRIFGSGFKFVEGGGGGADVDLINLPNFS